MTSIRPPLRDIVDSVVFDIGGVIVHADGQRIATAIRQVTNCTASATTCADSLQVAAMLSHELSLAEEDPKVLCRWAQFLCIDPELARVAWDSWKRIDGTLWTQIDADAHSVLSWLVARGIRIGALSNADGQLRASLGRKGLLKYFAFVYDSAVEGISKPDQRAFTGCLERIGSEAARAWYIGDSPLEVGAALASGYGKGILYRRVLSAEIAGEVNNGPVMIISRLRDLCDHVQRAQGW